MEYIFLTLSDQMFFFVFFSFKFCVHEGSAWYMYGNLNECAVIVNSDTTNVLKRLFAISPSSY